MLKQTNMYSMIELLRDTPKVKGWPVQLTAHVPRPPTSAQPTGVPLGSSTGGDNGGDAAAYKASRSLKKSAGGWGTTFGDALKGNCRHHVKEVIEHCLGDDYIQIEDVHVMQMRLHIYMLKKHAAHVHLPEKATENVGLGHVLGNKGGQMFKFQLYGQSFAFVSCHLPAHEGHVVERDNAVREIIKGAQLGHKHLGVDSQFSHVWWMGDLNYRINIKKLDEYARLEAGVEDKEAKPKVKEWSIVRELVDRTTNPDPAAAARAYNLLHRGDELATYGARFPTGITLEDAIGSHACSLEALAMRVTNGIPLESSLSYQLTL
jgi:hypothetical protein